MSPERFIDSGLRFVAIAGAAITPYLSDLNNDSKYSELSLNARDVASTSIDFEFADEIPPATATPTEERNVRDLPSIEGTEVLRTVRPGETFYALGSVTLSDGYVWDNIQLSDGSRGWIRSDGIQITEGAVPDVTLAASLVVLSEDGSPTEKTLLDVNTPMEQLRHQQNLLDLINGSPSLPKATFEQGNLGLLVYNSEDGGTVFTNVRDIPTDSGGVNEKGTLIAFLNKQNNFIPVLIGPGNIKDNARSMGIDVPDGTTFSHGDLQSDYLWFGDNKLFNWELFGYSIIDGVSAAEATGDSIILVDGQLPVGINFTIEGDSLVFSNGTVAQIANEPVRRVEIDESIYINQEDLEAERAKLSPELLERANLPEGDINRIEYSYTRDGFVDSEGRVWRSEIVRGTSDEANETRWCVELDRETYNLTDVNGKEFSFTMVFERPANQTIGRSESTNASFTTELEDNLRNLARMLPLSDTLNGITIFTTYVPKYSGHAKDGNALENYLEEYLVFENGNTQFALGMNVSPSGDNIHARAYEGQIDGKVSMNIPTGTPDKYVDIDYLGDAIRTVFTAAVRASRKEPGALLTLNEVLEIDSEAWLISNTLQPRPSGVTASFINATHLFELSN